MPIRSTFLALLRQLPRLTALAELISLLSFGAFWILNSHRVGLSYQPWSAARNVVMARFEFWEGAFGDATAASAFLVVFPLVVLQLLACVTKRAREVMLAEPWATRLVLITTLIAIPCLAVLALACSLSLGSGMVG